MGKNSSGIRQIFYIFALIVLSVFIFPINVFADTEVSGVISEDTTWTLVNSPYIVTGDVSVYKSSSEFSTLTIEPGVEIRFNSNCGLYVGVSIFQGALKALGTETDPILFTSSDPSPSPGSWKGLYFDQESVDTETLLEHCIIEYAGQSYNANIYCNSSSPHITDCTIRQGSGYGISANQGSPAISRCDIHSNLNGVYGNSGAPEITQCDIHDNTQYGIYGYNSSGSVAGCQVYENQAAGIYWDNSGSPTLSGNTIFDNGGSAISIHPNVDVSAGSGNAASGNTGNCLEIRYGVIVEDRTWNNHMGLPYVVSGDVSVYKSGTEFATLTIEPGVELRFNTNCGLYVGYSVYQGALKALGTESDPITFTSSAGSPAPGIWKGIYFYQETVDTETLLEHCIIEYGGQATNANIYCNSSSPWITDCIVRQGSGYGIYTNNGSPIISRCDIHSNLSGVYGNSGALEISECDIHDNTQHGINGYGGGGIVTGCQVYGNQAAGIYWDNSGTPTLSGNTIFDNGGSAISIHPNVDVSAGSGNAASGNTGNCLEVRAGVIVEDRTWNNHMGLRYVVSGDVSVYKSGTEFATLTIEPGVEMRFNTNCGLYVGYSVYQGALKALGTESDPITFTSSAGSPAPGTWKGIYFYQETVDTETLLEHCIIEYGGQATNANIYCNSSSPRITDCIVRQGSGYGIYTNNGSPIISRCDIHSNLSGVYGNSGALEISECDIHDNTQHGINGYGGGGIVTGCQVYGNQAAGIYWDNSGSPTLSGNTIYDNGGSAISIHPNVDVSAGSGNAASGNTGNCLEVRAGVIVEDRTWNNHMGLPYVVSGDVSVYKSGTEFATLTIEPGVEIRFNTNCGLYVGYSVYQGALKALGTASDPITFTSSAGSPAPGTWKGIYFYQETVDDQTLLEHCIIEYAGQATNANIYLNNARPTFQFNTIRASSYAGIYANGTGCDNAVISCNNFKDNQCGIYLTGNAQPDIAANNFLTNLQYGISNAGNVQVNAENNWWGDAQGPGESGDAINGDVDYDPWLVAVSDCINAPPPNSQPFPPAQPVPENNSVRVPITGGIVSLGWSCTDPNPQDTLTYDVYWGIDPENLSTVTQNTTTSTYDKDNLEEGTRYFWKIIARDNEGLESEGPVWRFITQGPPPDLVVSSISWEPESEMEAGTSVTFTATVQNIGAGPAVDPFQVGFDIDGTGIGNGVVSAILFPGETAQISRFWTAMPGEHIIQATADITGAITESNEENNSLFENLPLIADTIPPENVTGLQVQCFETGLVFTWVHSADTQGDLAGYRVYFNHDPVGVEIPATQNLYQRTGLAPASGYPFRITAYDHLGNESSGVSTTGVTLLQNPANVSAAPFSGYVNLTWDETAPAEYVKHYAIYVSDTDFTSVDGMPPAATKTGTSGGVAGLANNTTYYFAVTAVNLSGGERKTVTTVSQMPVDDTLGPVISDVQLNGSPMLNGTVLVSLSAITLNATDPAGVSRVEFSIDGGLYFTDTNGSSAYSCLWDVLSFEDGGHTLVITAYDTLGNTSEVTFALTITLDPPPAPVILQPESGRLVNTPAIHVSGQAEKGSEVILYLDSGQTGSWAPVNENGAFSVPLTLNEGESRIQAAARNRAGTGPLCSEVLVTLDSTIPDRPGHFKAESREAGRIRLSWTNPLNESVKGYHLYRSENEFVNKAEAIKVNTDLIGGTSYSDLPDQDGTWYYRVATVDYADNESQLSDMAGAVSDRLPPAAVSIIYSPAGAYDPGTGRMGPGLVNVILTVTEPLQTLPFLSINPLGATPLTVDLTRESDIEYSGVFVISQNTPTGTAFGVFSARDLVGNRGTEIASGGSVHIDTAGPGIIELLIQPETPIKNDETNPAAVTVTMGLNEAIKGGETPALSYMLSGPGRSPILVDTLTQISTRPGHAQTWQGTFTLPFDAGLAESETLVFEYLGVDDLDNENDRIYCDNQFQVYQGNLPPLEAPTTFTGESLPQGKIKLSWNAVAGAAGYALYRQAPDETELTPYMSLGTALSYTDEPDVDGLYIYAIASVRQDNGQEAISGLSSTVEIYSDATVSGRPQNLTLELVPQGIRAAWEAAPYTEDVTYSLYRSDQAEIISVDGLTPVFTGIADLTAVDSMPSSSDHCYVVTAVDQAGNESAPSNSVYLNFELLPVASLNVRQEDNERPVISWTHTGSSIDGYDFYLNSVKLNPDLLMDTAYTDMGYAEDERRYTVVAVDDSGHASLGRSITLPVLSASLNEGRVIRRGIMNRLVYVVENHSLSNVENIHLKVEIDGRMHVSDTFSVGAGGSTTVPVIVGGYEDFPDLSACIVTIEITPNPGEKVEIVRSCEISVLDGMLVAGILNEEFIRGGTGRVQFTLENSGEEAIEIVTAEGPDSASGEIAFYLLDSDGNVLGTSPFQQNLGEDVITLANGKTVARISKGAIFTSDTVELQIPAATPDHLTLELDIAQVHYHLGEPDQISMQGLSTTHDVSLIDTTYWGELLNIAPENSTGDQDIEITGRAVHRATGDPLPLVPLELVVSVNGFERRFDIFTNDSGTFRYLFTPTAGESGRYTVRVVHPDLTDRPVQGAFVISRVFVSPTTVNMSIPKNYEQDVEISVSAQEGSEANNLTLVYEENDQPGGEFLQGVHVLPGPSVPLLEAGRSASLGFTIWADNTADAARTIVLKVKSDETGADAWAVVTINAAFSDAQPVIYTAPDHVETGMALDDTMTETIRIENRGTADLTDVRLEIVNQDGTTASGWVLLSAAADHDALAVGESMEVSVSFAPASSAVLDGIYSFYLRLTAANYPETDILLHVAVTQSGEGSALFKVSDIYTGTLDSGSQEIIQGLVGARIKVQNEAVLTEEYTGTTDSLGELLLTDLPAGRYKFRITAENHQEYIGRLWIKPGITSTQALFLAYNLVTVEWSVTETTIEDEYEVTLNAVYETDVPAAVVVAEPSSVTLPEMAPGDVFTGEVKLTNYGIIYAENIDFFLPEEDPYYRYELLGAIPEKINAKESIRVPYRITCLRDQAGGTGSGGATNASYKNCVKIAYEFTCANGDVAKGVALYCITKTISGDPGAMGWFNIGSLGTAGEGDEEGGSIDIAWGEGGGQSVSISSLYEILKGIVCAPPPELPCEACDECCNMRTRQKVDSNVDLIRGEYTDEIVDLFIKVPGHLLEVKRQYYNMSWHFNNLSQKITIHNGIDPDIPESIEKDRVTYKSADPSGKVFSFGQDRNIFVTDTGYRWQNKSGDWQLYDAEGRLVEYGTKNRPRIVLIYEPGEDGKLTGIADHSENQVLWYEYNDNDQLASVHDVSGRTVSYEYDGDNLTRVVDLLENETLYGYDSDNRLVSKQDPEGRTINITYISSDAFGYVTGVTDENGIGSFFEYGYDEGKKEYYVRVAFSSGRIKEVWFDRYSRRVRMDINGKTIEKIVYDENSEIKTDSNGNKTFREYDEWHNLIKVTYPDGAEVSYEYEPGTSIVSKKTDERGIITAYEYDEGNLIKSTEALGTSCERITEYTYDDDGNRLTERKFGDTPASDAITTMTYDENGNLETITDPEGHDTTLTCDVMGNVLTIEDTKGNIWQYEYNDMGWLVSSTDPLNNKVQQFYDKVGNIITAIDPEENETLYEYDGHDNPVKITRIIDLENEENNIVSVREYDTDNRVTKQIDPEGKELRYIYNLDGLLIKSIDGNRNEFVQEYEDVNGETCIACLLENAEELPSKIVFPTFSKIFQYDERGRKTREDDVLSDIELHSTLFQYDLSGNIVSITDNNGLETIYDHNALNRMIKQIESNGDTITYTFDGMGNLTAFKDKEENVTSYEYDGNGRVIKETRPLGEVTLYTFDPLGNLSEKIDAKNQKTQYLYDDANRLSQIMYYNSASDVSPSKTVAFSYDKVGNLISYDDGVTSAQYAYDRNYRKISETVNYGSFELSYQYTYYKNGRKKTFTGPDNITYEYSYDGNNQLTEVKIPDIGSISYHSFTWNRPRKVTYPGGTTRYYAYDPLMRITSITAKDPAQNIIMNYGYGYDKMNNLLNKNTKHGNYVYHYDESYRLTTAENAIQDNEAFTYDKAGNRKTAASVTGEWFYNENNELLGYSGVSFEYDDNGNMIKKTVGGQVTKYIYNIENRLIRIEDGNSNVISEYYYDPWGRRLWKYVDGERAHFFYSDEGIVGEYDTVGNEFKTYGFVPDSVWTTAPLFQKVGQEYYWYQNDFMGTPQKVVKNNGQPVWSAIYESFGSLRVDLSEVENALRFPGQYHDQETDLYYNRHRYFDPNTGRYIRTDPLSLGHNFYIYASGNPNKLMDPLGLCDEKDPDGPCTGKKATYITKDQFYKNMHDEIRAKEIKWRVLRAYSSVTSIDGLFFPNKKDYFDPIANWRMLRADTQYRKNEKQGREVYCLYGKEWGPLEGKYFKGHELNYFFQGMLYKQYGVARKNIYDRVLAWKAWRYDKTPSLNTIDMIRMGYDEYETVFSGVWPGQKIF